jgi:hypothetical protein
MMSQPLASTNNSRPPVYTLPTQVYQDMVRNADAYGNRSGKADAVEIQQFGNILGYYAQAYGQAFQQTKDPIYKQVSDMLMRDWYATTVIAENYGRFANASTPNQKNTGIGVQDVTQVAIRDRDANTISNEDFTTSNPYLGKAPNPQEWQFAYNQTTTPRN